MRDRKWIYTAAFALIAGLSFIRLYGQAKKDPPDKDDQEQQTSARVIVKNGRTVIRLTDAGQARAGIKTISLKPERERKEIAAPAVVLDATSLLNLASSYAAAQGNLRKARNDVTVSRAEYKRLKALYANQENVSAKVLEAAEGKFNNDQESVAMARRNLNFQSAALRQSWGNAVAKWVEQGSKQLDRVFSRKDALAQITLPSDGPQAAPARVLLNLPGGRSVYAQFVSPFPRVDPRIQGTSFLYVAQSTEGLAPGLDLTARIPVGQRLSGVVIPASAVVWLSGERWVYVETAANEFTRRVLTAGFPVAGGRFESRGFAPGERIVTAGAQMLLSEEFRSQSGGAEEDDD